MKRTVIGLTLFATALFGLLFFVFVQDTNTDTEILELPDGYRVQCAIDAPVYSLWIPRLDGDGGFDDPSVFLSERDAIRSAISYEVYRREPKEDARDKYQWKDCKGKEAP